MELLDIAIDAARAAGSLLLERFAGPRLGVETKSSSTDMVSDADREAEKTIIERIRRARPADGFVAEESGTADGSSGIRWVIDPLDGTTNFLFGIPQWCVSIAAEDGDGGLAGVVFDPVRDELFTAARGRRAHVNGEPIRPTDAADLQRALIATGFSYLPEEREQTAGMLKTILPRVRDIRRIGSAALDLCWVACGRFDGYYEVPVHHWDRAAGELIAREAGAFTHVLDAVGASGPGLIVAAPKLFDELRALVIAAHPTATIADDA